MRHVTIIGKQLLSVLWQAVAAVPEGGVVVVVADPDVETDAIDDLACIKAVCSSLSVKLVEICHPHCQERVCEEFDCFSFATIGKQQRRIFLDRTLLE